jgi:membrane protein
MGLQSAARSARGLAEWAQRRFPVRVVMKFIQDNGGSQAVLIAWNALTAVFPIALALAAIGGFVLSSAGVSPDDIYNMIVRVFPQDANAQKAALQGVQVLRNQSGVFAIVAVLGFIWTASNLFGAMEQAFSAVYGTEGRSFVRQKLMSLAMMGLFAVLALLAIGASTLQALIDQIPGLPKAALPGELGRAAQIAIGAVAGFLLFFAIYYVVPNRRQSPGRVLLGAILAGIAFEALTQLFPVYIQLNRGINQYGSSFAFLFVLLAFFYFLGLITMLGAEVNAVFEQRREHARAKEDTAATPVRSGERTPGTG